MFVRLETFRLLLIVMSTLTLKYAGVNAARGLNKRLVLKSVECPIYNNDIIEEYNCTLVKTKYGASRFNVKLVYQQEVRNITELIQIFVNRQGVNQTYYTGEISLCQALGQAQQHFALKIAFKELFRTSNLPLRCPLKKNFPYYIRDFGVDAYKLPAFVPDLTWIFLGTFKIDNKKVHGFHAHGTTEYFTSVKINS